MERTAAKVAEGRGTFGDVFIGSQATRRKGMTSLVFGSVLPWLLVGVGTCLGLQLVRQNGRLLLRLESIEKRLVPRKTIMTLRPSRSAICRNLRRRGAAGVTYSVLA